MRIAFVYYASFSSFIKRDYEIICKAHEVEEVNFSCPGDAVKLMKAVAKCDLALIWFAGGHAFVAVLLSKLLRKKSMIIVGGFDVARVPEIDYGRFTQSWTKKFLTKSALQYADRVLVVDPEDVATVIVGDVKTWGCCSHCALGVAARTGKDIEVRERDRLTGETVVVKTLNGSVAGLEPATAVAWFGQRTKPDGTHASAGCFHQGFFANAENLKKWVDANPLETGEQITIAKALADKMKLTPQQIGKACKIGECAPK